MNIRELYSDGEFEKIGIRVQEKLAKGAPHDGIIYIAKQLKKDGTEIPVEIKAEITLIM